MLGYIPSILLHSLLSFAQDPDSAPIMSGLHGGYGYVLAIGLIFTNWLQTLTLQHSYHAIIREGMRARNACMAQIYRKLLTLSPNVRASLGSGVINNLLSTDAQHMENVFWMGYYIIFAPIQITLTLLLLLHYLGKSALVGVFVLIIALFLQIGMSRVGSRFSLYSQQRTDKRISMITEVLTAIKTIKIHNWEIIFIPIIDKLRIQECNMLLMKQIWNGTQAMILQSIPAIVSTATFYTYVLLTKSPLTPGIAFTALPLFNILQTTLSSMPWTIQYIIEFWVSAKRLAQFYNLPDKENISIVYEYRRYCYNNDGCDEPVHNIGNISSNSSSSNNDNNSSSIQPFKALHQEYCDPTCRTVLSLPIVSPQTTLKSNISIVSLQKQQQLQQYHNQQYQGAKQCLDIVETTPTSIPIGEIRIINTDFWLDKYTSSNTGSITISTSSCQSLFNNIQSIFHTNVPQNTVTIPLPTLHIPKLVFPAGSFTCIVGPNGSGKSLFINAILGNIPHTPSIFPHIGDILTHLIQPDTENDNDDERNNNTGDSNNNNNNNHHRIFLLRITPWIS